MERKVFLVTGATRGIGLATSRLCAKAGFRMVLVARSADQLSRVADDLGDPASILAVPCDVTDWSQICAIVDRAVSRFGRLDVAFANAGITTDTSFLGGKADAPDGWRDMVLANVLGPALTARAALPALAASTGHLVLTGSADGRTTRPGSLYSATKWAVTGLAQAIRAECVGTGVRVTLVQPGLVDTPSIADDRTEPKLRAEDVARAVLFAVSQPRSVDVNEILLRPVGQGAYR
jgi:NADP-dependent 3-hydroxy acid dehydrogenase YdfG